MVDCEASTFPLVNLTKVSTAAHSTQCFDLQLFHSKKVTFWYLSFFNSKYLVALPKAGLIFNPVPAIPTSTAGGGGSPSYSGFFHRLAVFDDQSSPYFSPNSYVLQNVRNASPRVFYPVLIFGSSRATCILLT